MSCTKPKEPKSQAPAAAKILKKLSKHGKERHDYYYWMNERDDPDVIKYLKAENGYQRALLEPTEELQKKLFKEMKKRIGKTDTSAPYSFKDYLYYERVDEKSDYEIYCRKKKKPNSKEEILLDSNKLAESHEFFDLKELEMSSDQSMFAYSYDTKGRRIYNISLKDLDTGVTKENIITDTTGDFQWAEDHKTIFYTKQDPVTLRSYQLWRYDIFDRSHVLVYEEQDETFDIDLWKSKSDRYLFMESASTLSTEIYYLDAKNPKADLKLFAKRKKDLEYAIEDGGDRFFILTNHKAKNFTIMECSLDKTEVKYWKSYQSYDKNIFTEEFSAFKDHIVVRESHDGLIKLKIIDRKTKESHYIETNDDTYTLDLYVSMEYNADYFTYSYESMTTPYSIFEYSFASHNRKLLKEKEVHGGFNKNNYVSKRLFAEARDGAIIPISIVHHKDTKPSKDTPLLQYAYGAYGHTLEADFSSQRLSLLDRGFIYAQCHVRGGSYKGREWYEKGKMQHKKNTFYDFIDCSQFLIKSGYTSKQKLYAQGGSAGGLLIGAVANMAGELYHGMIAEVPFVDVLTTMLDDSIPLTTSEYDEWGDPRKKKDYDYISSYSPYDNVERKAYPHLLVTTGYHDSQVQYWEPAKWVAKLRQHKTDDNILAFKTDFDAGHGGKTGRFGYLKDVAYEYAFLIYLSQISK